MFKILSLDGGGIKGTFTAAALDVFEQQLDTPLVEHFDLTVGTSTGGIIALGLACGLRADSLLQLYVKRGHDIFPSARRGWTAMLESIFAPRYAGDELKQVLQGYLPDAPFSTLKTPVAITSFDGASARPVVFKTQYHQSLIEFADLSVVDVAMATSAAPTFFEAARCGHRILLDGGIWANCPAMVGITEALTLFGRSIREIHVLSIGATSSPSFVTEAQQSGGWIDWARPVNSMLMHAAKEGAIHEAQKLSREFIRVDEIVEPGRFGLDRVEETSMLRQLGEQAARRMWNEVQPIFFPETQRPIRC